MVWKLIKAVFFLVVLGAIGLVGYAYVGPIFMPGDFDPHQEEVRQPIRLDMTE